jgi:hypothetical protein
MPLNDFYGYNGTKLGNIHAHPIVTHDESMAFMLQYYGLPASGRGMRLSNKAVQRAISLITLMVQAAILR